MVSFSGTLSCSSSFSSQFPLVFSLWSLLLRAVKAASKYQWNCWHESGAAINPQPLHHNKASLNYLQPLIPCSNWATVSRAVAVLSFSGYGHHQLHPDQKQGHLGQKTRYYKQPVWLSCWKTNALIYTFPVHVLNMAGCAFCFFNRLEVAV